MLQLATPSTQLSPDLVQGSQSGDVIIHVLSAHALSAHAHKLVRHRQVKVANKHA